MKQLFGILFTLFIILTGCKKYENGPSISLKSKENRIVGTWRAEKENLNVIYSFKKEGNYEELVYSSSELFMYSKIGTWQLTDKKENITVSWTLDRTEGFYYVDINGNVIHYSDTTQIHIISPMVSKYKIFQLSNTELWLGDETGIEFKCKKQ